MAHQGPRGPTVKISKAMILAGSAVVRRLRTTDQAAGKIAEDVYRAMHQKCIEEAANNPDTKPIEG